MPGERLFATLLAAVDRRKGATHAAARHRRPGSLRSSSETTRVREVEPSVVAVLTDVGEGSGVVYSSDGTIVTNQHVVAPANEITIVLADGDRLPAEVVAADMLTDLAVLRVDRTDLPGAELETELPPVGSLAIAVGNPLGFESTVTAGIVSGLHRSIVGADGNVIGINVAFIPPHARAVSIGFAIPAETVVSVVEELVDDGEVEHVFFGIRPTAVTPQVAERLGLARDHGVLVLDVVPDSPADRGGIEAVDLVVEVDGETVRDIGAFLRRLRGHDAGDDMTVTVLRDGDERRVEVVLDEGPRDGV